MLLFLLPANGVAAASPQLPEAAPCLPGDPFELARLAAAVADDSPPTTPVVINRHITVQRVGKGSLSDSPSEMVTGPTATGNPNPSEPPADLTPLDNVPLRIFNTRTQFDFRVTFSDELLQTINECHERNGLAAPGGPATPGAVEGRLFRFLPLTANQSAGPASGPTMAGQPAVPDGWSDGVDTRILRTPTTLWPWRTITNSSSGPTDTEANCTLTLIGPRHLVTAAHCLVNFGTANWKTRLLTRAGTGRASRHTARRGWMPPRRPARWHGTSCPTRGWTPPPIAAARRSINGISARC